MKKYIDKSAYLCYACCLMLLAFSACKKEVTSALPGDKEAIALNFFTASDVMQTAYGSTRPSATGIFVNTFQPQLPLVFGGTTPYFDYIATDGGEYPTVIKGGFMNFVNYDYKPEGNRLYFTDTAKIVVLDTLVRPAAKSHTCVYLADAPVTSQNNPVVYKMIAVTEDRAEVPAGKMGIRFIHLSPDAGSLSCNLLKADGSLTSLLPDNLEYGQASAYQYLDSTAVASGIIQFSISNPANGAMINTGVSYTPGRSYAIVVTGFLNDQQRQVRSGTNPGGSPKYTSITINRNLRATVRKTY